MSDLKQFAASRADQIIARTLDLDGSEQTIRVKKLKAKDIIRFAKLPDHEGGVALAAASIVDDQGNPVFTANELGEMDWQLVNALMEAANQVNGLAANVDQAAKN